MPEHDQPPLRLGELAHVDSPDVMRAALRRFRRRTLVRAIAIVLLILGLPVVLRGLNPRGPSWVEKVARAQTVQIERVVDAGRFRVLVLDARRLRPVDAEEEDGGPPAPLFAEGNRVLHIVVLAEGIRNDEELALDPLLGAGPVDAVGSDPRRAARALEAFLPFAPNQERIGISLYALTGSDAGARGPGTHSQEQCAVPLNPFGVCELVRGEGRQIGSVTLDLIALGIPDEIRGG